MFLVFVDGDEDQWGRLLKLEKSNDGNIEGALIFCRDMGSIHPLKNMTLLKSLIYNLLKSETLFLGICMCFYAYVPLSQICRRIVNIQQLLMRWLMIYIKANISGNVESLKQIF